MHSQSKYILGNLIQTQIMAGQNFTQILNILEDVVVGAIITAVTTPSSDLVLNTPDDVLLEFIRVTRGKIKQMERAGQLDVKAIVKAALQSEEHQRKVRQDMEDHAKATGQSVESLMAKVKIGEEQS